MKTKNVYELDPERLATTDEHGHRVYLYPEDVQGKWKNRRTIFSWALLFAYLVLPWIYINQKPLLMIDILKREFTFFGSTLYGVEPIFFFLVLAAGLFFIAFTTSTLGRVWCGWACPQTVFIQTIFSKVESLIEGKSRKRRELDLAGMSFQKVSKKILKWIIFTIISLHIAHTFIGYFIGPRELFLISLHSPLENLGIFTTTMIASAVILLDFGWFREQFCIIACPYGRIQSVMMDENSLVVAYDSRRGEFRRGTLDVPKELEGDCINCYHCVKVCPTGIDIRRGTQLECIACTACIDACDDIMTKLHKPTGLIRYTSENQINGLKRKLLSLRPALYLLIFVSLVIGAGFFLKASSRLQLVFLRSSIPFQITQEGRQLTNHFTLKLSHQGGREYALVFEVADPDLQKSISVITPIHPTLVKKADKKIILFFKFDPKILINGTRKISLIAKDTLSGQIVSSKEVVLVGPTH